MLASVRLEGFGNYRCKTLPAAAIGVGFDGPKFGFLREFFGLLRTESMLLPGEEAEPLQNCEADSRIAIADGRSHRFGRIVGEPSKPPSRRQGC